MKFSALVAGLLLISSCAAPPPSDSWSEGSLAIALVIDSESSRYYTETAQIFDASHSERTAALKASEIFADDIRRHSQAWRTMYSFASTIESTLAGQSLEFDKINATALAVDDYHRQLLQSGFGPYLRFNLNSHQRIIDRINECYTVAEAIEICAAVAETTSQQLTLSWTKLEAQLKQLSELLLGLNKKANSDLLRQHQLLLDRQQRYQTAVDPPYDSDFELKQVAREIELSLSTLQDYYQTSNKLNYLNTYYSQLIQQCIIAGDEWWRCIQSLSGDARAATQNFRLFKERAEAIQALR
ncbi:MAG: hypothetical protein QGF46_01070 [Planctomycetota bacterium]|nr:hypothetical protein [Planctomycetota bacterium]